MASRQQQFVDRVYYDARAAGLPDPQARLAAAQAALETGYGKSVVGNNYFGIKAGSSWDGPTVNVRTKEEVRGRPVSIRDNFRAYDNPRQSFTDWAETVGRRWSDALAAPTFSQAVDALNAGKRGGYATDSRYDTKLEYINNRFGPDPRGILSVIDPRDLPTPSPSPQRSNATGIMNVIDPPTPMAVERQALPNIQTPAKSSGGSLADAAEARNRERMVSSFDYGRFGNPTNAASAATSFNPDRFGPGVNTAQGLQQLQRGLLDQQLDYGILPALPTPVTVNAAPPVRQYVDPVVTRSAQPTSSMQTAYAPMPQPAAPMPAAINRGLLSEQQRANAAKSARDQKLQTAFGSIGGALLGGALLGPIGGLLGGVVGNNFAGRNYFPDAPMPIAGQQSMGNSYNDLNDYGREVYSSSQNFRDAVDSRSPGLW